MPCAPLPPLSVPLPDSTLEPTSASTADPEAAGAFGPALLQLRTLPPAALERLVRAWLLRPAARSPRRFSPCERRSGAATFHLLLDGSPLPLPLALRVRVHQRRSRLQVQHVEAFAGHLVRAGVPAGLLVTTGEITPEAIRAAAGCVQPRIRLYSGPEWVAELAAHRLGPRRRRLWRWVLALGGLFGEPGPAASGAAEGAR